MSTMTIRRMAEKDLERVSAIEQEIFSDPWSFNAFKTDVKNDMAWPLVVEFEGSIIGYTNLYRVAGEIQIGNLAVAPGFRQRGVAKRMMSEILKIAGDHKCNSIFLEVRVSNKPAQILYESFGFKCSGRGKNYYANPRESAVLMVKEL